ncbi:hypothetical protein AA313_de0205335 [Arthrobotrys entomopaga]|nr:hypothetical protein AA313_de0205335 [Arthrobotrys entomopaga]
MFREFKLVGVDGNKRHVGIFPGQLCENWNQNLARWAPGWCGEIEDYQAWLLEQVVDFFVAAWGCDSVLVVVWNYGTLLAVVVARWGGDVGAYLRGSHFFRSWFSVFLKNDI